jgi:ATP-dependent Lhr-like helicase
MRRAYPYRDLTRQEFEQVVHMLAEGFSTKRGRRAALLHFDGVNGRLRGRRGARLVALTSGGAIPDNADYRVVLEPSETFIGTVNEDFAVESLAGDIFQLGNASWRILRINSGVVRVDDAHGQPPNIPFWLGEAPGRTDELSRAVSRFRQEIEARVGDGLTDWLQGEMGLSESGARQLTQYFSAAHKTLGAIPSQDKLILERFFDESGGMQLVLHSTFGIRVNRAWGLALRKRFCRSFNFELQAAATDDAIILSLGTQHSFPLAEVFHYLNSKTVRDLLIQALLDAPMFPVRWRWNATRSLALPRQRGGRKIPAPLQRMESENLLAAVFPDQLACLENIAGDREIPDHPLVHQTVEDCLTEAMDLDGLIAVLRRIESGTIECIARDLPEPSPLAHEILNAKPYAFLDNAPLEERRTQAVYTRRASEGSTDAGLGVLDAAAIDKVTDEAWPRPGNADEVHESLLLLGVMTPDEMRRSTAEDPAWLDTLIEQHRTGRVVSGPVFWVAAERLALVQAVYPGARTEPNLVPPASALKTFWEREEAIKELVRGRLEVSGPVTHRQLAEVLQLPESQIDTALLTLEAEGFVLRGKFRSGAQDLEWCERRLLARIHRLTINRLRAEIQPVSVADFQRFLLAWQHVTDEHKVDGPEGLQAVLEQLDGFEVPVGAWEPEVLALRVKEYTPPWLDQLCYSGRIGWGRLTPPLGTDSRMGRGWNASLSELLVGTDSTPSHSSPHRTPSLPEPPTAPRSKPFAPIRSSPVSLFTRQNLPHWLALSQPATGQPLGPETAQVLTALTQGGALFFGELVKRTGLLPSRVEQALAELTALGLVTADSFEGLRALLLPQEKRVPFADTGRKRHHRAVSSVEFAGRWSLLRPAGPAPVSGSTTPDDVRAARDSAFETLAWTLLRRYGVVFRRMIERESLQATWFDLGRVYRRLEARGEIRGGFCVGGVGGEQFALPEAIGLLRSIRKAPPTGELVVISGADPLNLAGILTPGQRVPAITSSRILLRDGVPALALVGGQLTALSAEPELQSNARLERALRIGSISPALRPYYG